MLQHRLSVLVVDDDEPIARYLALGLRRIGFATEVAHSAHEALSRLEANPEIGVVLTDVRMPGDDGLFLAQRILRERLGLAAVRVILITGHASLDDATAAVRIGASDFLRKPFRLADAVRAVSAALEAAEQARSEEAQRLVGAARLSELERLRDELTHRLARAEAPLRASPDFATAYRADLALEIRAISHALRTPLNHIAGGTELLAVDDPTGRDTALSYLRSGLEEALHAVELVEELQRAGQSPARAATTDVHLARLVETASQQLAACGADRAIAVRILAAPDLVPIRAPEPDMRQILVHCISAALKWTPEGGAVDVDIRQLAHDDGRRWSVVTLACGRGDAFAALPDGPTFPDSASPLSRTQEGLHFAIAKRLAGGLGGSVTSWSPDQQTMALRVALPG